MSTSELLEFGGSCLVPTDICTCPECGAPLWVESIEWNEETGAPTKGGLNVDCTEDKAGEHRYWQSDWQEIVDAVERWCDAE